ncbi:hypothetical protein CALVIDRAFT_281161 [Calocera viscosa TUFC12733]|uniref:PX domain-containing protein n=1 Tax=Calocera viscosa (strain TUFC12733) TaxID=1330018 RepID=A0A167R614_CALVF|nr:hypothetical protein CALVIDRAFT_281161 [Calocera viscosa TUFC12733]
MAFADVPINPQGYRRAIVKDCPEYYTAVLSDPTKIGGAWHYGVYVSRDTVYAVASSSSSAASQRSLKSLSRPAGFHIRRKWEDCLDLQRVLESEVVVLEKARRKHKEPSRLYPSDRAASFESLPGGDTQTWLLGQDAIPKLSRKSSLFKASQAMISKRQTEFGALVAWLFGADSALAEDLRASRPVRDWFAYWRSDKECEGKVRPPTAPIHSTMPPFLGRPRQESVSSMTTCTTASDGSALASPEVRLSQVFRPSVSYIKTRPMSVLTDISVLSDDYLDELSLTMDCFPVPPPLEDDAIRALSPTLRRRAASSDQLSRLGLMTPVPEGAPVLTPGGLSPIPPSPLEPSPAILPQKTPMPVPHLPELPPPASPRSPISPRSPVAPPQEQLQAILPAKPKKPRHWQSMLNLRESRNSSLAFPSPPSPSPRLSTAETAEMAQRRVPALRDQRHLSTHARSNSKFRNGMFISAPTTPHLGSPGDLGFQFGDQPQYPSQHSPALTNGSAGSGPSFGLGSPMHSTPDLVEPTARARTESSRSSMSSEAANLQYAGSQSNMIPPDSMYSSVTTLDTDVSEPIEYDRLASTPLPPHSARDSDNGALDDTLVSRIMLRAQQNGISSRPSSGDQELIDEYLYSSIEASLSPTRSLSSVSDEIDKKYGTSWISMDADEDTVPIMLDKSLPPSPMTDRTSWSSPRKQSINGSISSPEQFPKPFQHRPAGQFHLPWSTPTSPPRTPPGDEPTASFPPVVVKACHVDTGSIVSFKAARSVNLNDLRGRVEQKFLDTEGLRLQEQPTQKWRLAYSKKGITQQASRRNLAALAMTAPTSPMSPVSPSSIISRTRSDSGTSLPPPELDNLIFIHSDEDLSSALAACGSGKLTLHIVA